jgi:hypothetical protein
MRETQIERRLCKGVKKLGGLALKFTPSGYAGMPDRIVLLPGGWTAFVETKAPGKELRALQDKRAKELMALGFPFYKLDTLEKVDDFLLGRARIYEVTHRTQGGGAL